MAAQLAEHLTVRTPPAPPSTSWPHNPTDPSDLSRVNVPFAHALLLVMALVVRYTGLQEDQIYRVDHYLGKRGVQQILNFRLAAPAADELFTNKHVQSVKVVMTEAESCEGRTSFYDEYGVVRDVHQNHLTEVCPYRTACAASFSAIALPLGDI